MTSAAARGLAVVLPLVCAGACAGPVADDGAFASEELALVDAEGRAFCPEPEKVLVCHVPTGNRANARELCVGASAKAAHERHGDRPGACAAGAAGAAGEAGEVAPSVTSR